jgi:3-hydroxybutyryl-CoA dehydrogenase
MEIKKVAILGFTGAMGRGIAQITAQAGYQVVASSRSVESMQKGLATIKSGMARAVERGRMTQADMDKVMANIKGTTNVQDFKDCDLAIEVAVEDLEIKKATFVELDGILPPNAILATNTSVLSVTTMAMVTKRPGKVIGLHFFNPATAMKLIEIIKPITVSDETVAAAVEFAKKVGKTPVTLPDTPGFIVNRLAVAFILNAIRLYESKIATKEDIDTAITLGLNHPMGPLALSDLIGSDVVLAMADGIYANLKDPAYIAPTVLRSMVAANWLGQKSGKGFYDYPAKK